jgi:hypothetical protein
MSGAYQVGLAIDYFGEKINIEPEGLISSKQ